MSIQLQGNITINGNWIINPLSPFISWNISSAVYDSKRLAPTLPSGTLQSFFIRDNGLKLYICSNNGHITQWTMSVAWDISTATYDTVTFDATANVTTAGGIYFSSDGTKMYLFDAITNQTFYQYPLSVAWDLSTCGASNANYFENNYGQQFIFSSDGTKMVFNFGSSVKYYTLGTPWIISTLTEISTFDLYAQDTNSYGVWLTPDGKNMYVTGDDFQKIFQYSVRNAWNISTSIYTMTYFVTSGQGTNPGNIFINPSGKMYVSFGGGANDIRQYTVTD